MSWLRSLAAILLGGILSLFLGCAGGIVAAASKPEPPKASASVLVKQRGPNRPSDDSIARLLTASVGSTALEPVAPSTQLLTTILAATIAGYLAAWIAGRAPLEHGALTAWPYAVFIVAGLLFGREPVWDGPAYYVLAGGVGGGMAGGWIQKRQRAHVNSNEPR